MYHEFQVKLSEGQKAKLAKAMKDGSALKLRLGKNALTGNDELMLSLRQIEKLKKAKQKKHWGGNFILQIGNQEKCKTWRKSLVLPDFFGNQSFAICDERESQKSLHILQLAL